MIAKNYKRDFSLYLRDRNRRCFFYCFGKQNQVYASIAGIIKESSPYDMALRIPATIIINLLTFIWL